MTGQPQKQLDFETILSVGGKSNSLGKTSEVIAAVLSDRRLLPNLYDCMFSEDPWVRMRAADAFEKVCREHPEWIKRYIDKLQDELSGQEQQPSIKWHIAQIYGQVDLSDAQKRRALTWLAAQLHSIEVDWIVAANSMKTLAYFTQKGDLTKPQLLQLLDIHTRHKSHSVVKKAKNLIREFS